MGKKIEDLDRYFIKEYTKKKPMWTWDADDEKIIQPQKNRYTSTLKENLEAFPRDPGGVVASAVGQERGTFLG